MKYIELTRGKKAKVDDEDFEFLSQWKWTAYKNRAGNWYAVRGFRKNKIQVQIRMHRLILKAPENTDVDHRSGEGLDNQKSNLRLATRQQNLRNTRVRSKSGYKGVSWRKDVGLWESRINTGIKCIRLGYFSSLVAAAKSYNVAAKELFGDFARLNSI